MTAAVLRALIYADSRLLWRDPLLGWILALPIGLALLLRPLIPRVQEGLLAGTGFDLTPYHPLVMGGYLMTAPGMVGMVVGFLFLDERDARTLTALRTTPLSMRQLMDGDALGKRFAWNKEWHTVVGVVPDAKQREYTDPAAPMFYVLNRSIGNFLIRTAVPPESLMPAVRGAIVSQDHGAVVSRLTTMNALLATSIAEERYRALLSSLFGFSALLLSAIGIYGIVARSVTDRLREFGVRSALGATPRNIRILVLGHSARLVGLGLLLGIPTALGASRAIGAMLYGVSPTAPHTFVMVTAVLAAAAGVGTFAPVHRAGRVDPAVALRHG